MTRLLFLLLSLALASCAMRPLHPVSVDPLDEAAALPHHHHVDEPPRPQEKPETPTYPHVDHQLDKLQGQVDWMKKMLGPKPSDP